MKCIIPVDLQYRLDSFHTPCLLSTLHMVMACSRQNFVFPHFLRLLPPCLLCTLRTVPQLTSNPKSIHLSTMNWKCWGIELIMENKKLHLRFFSYLNRYKKKNFTIFWTQIYFCMPEIFKTNVSSQFLSTNHLLNLCSRVVNSQRLFCSQRAGVKC